MSDTQSSFYATQNNIGTTYPPNVNENTQPTSGNTKAPSSFYPNGGEYAEADPVAALNSATQAAASAAAAASSATAAAASDADAQAQAATATTQAGDAAASASNAYTNAQSAQGSASEASTSATNASNSATAAAGSASTASTQATNASNSATAAAGSASAAATSATNAANSATAAATSASNAASAVQAAAGTVNPAMDGAVAPGTSTKWAHEDHVHPTDTTRAPLASPAFTGTPTAPTPSHGDNSTKLATTAFVLANAASAGTGYVAMYPPPSRSGLWTVLDAYGNAVNTIGSQTCGLQEAINYAITSGMPLRVFGGGPLQEYYGTGTTHGNTTVDGLTTTSAMLVGDYITGPGIPSFTTITAINSSSSITISHASTASTTGNVRVTRGAGANLGNYIACSVGISLPPVEQWDCELHDVNITFANTVNGPGLQFDSTMMVTWMHTGQLVYQPSSPGANSYAVLWNPTNPVPLDGITAVTGSKFYISNHAAPASNGVAQAVWGFNASVGGIDTCFFGSTELNGTGTGSSSNTNYGILVYGLGASSAFQQNTFDVTNIHIVAAAGIQLGTNTTNSASCRGNKFNIGGINPAGAGSVGVDTFCGPDEFHIGMITNEQGTLNTGVVLQSSSIGNQLYVGRIDGATVVRNDLGTSNLFMLGGRFSSDSLQHPPVLGGYLKNVSLATASADFSIPITLPFGITQYRVREITVTNASAAITSATVGVFTGANGTGGSIVAPGTALSGISNAAANNANSLVNLTLATFGQTALLTVTPLHLQVNAAQSGLTVSIYVFIQPLP